MPRPRSHQFDHSKPPLLKGIRHLVSFVRFLALPLVPSPPSKLIMSAGPEFGNSIRNAPRTSQNTVSISGCGYDSAQGKVVGLWYFRNRWYSSQDGIYITRNSFGRGAYPRYDALPTRLLILTLYSLSRVIPGTA